ncbi:cellulose binding domain-containing protein, partial [Streptomyces massasporeus]
MPRLRPRTRPRRQLTALAAALSLPLGLTAVGATPAQAADVRCSIDYKTNDWGSGFTAELTLTNRATTALNGWTLTYAYAGDQKLTNGWSGVWSQSGKNVTVTNASWNGTLAAGAATTIGAQFTYTGANTAPTSFAVDGTPCTGAHRPPVAVLTSPAPGAVFTAGDAVPLAATAAAADGATVSKVEFYSDTALLGTDTTAPFTFGAAGLATGTHSLYAKAYDSLGASAESAPVGITVAAGPALVAAPMRGPGQRRRLGHLDADTSNLRAALDRALAAPGTGRNAGAALRLVDALAWYWVMRGRLGEALRHATAALRAVPPQTPQAPEQTPGAPQAPDRMPGAPQTPARPEQAALRARVEVWRTGLAIMGGDGTDRRQRIAKALTAYEGTEPLRPSDHAWARWFLAHALCGTGSQSEGGRLTGEALDGARAHGDRWVEAAALADRSVQRLLGGDVAGAEQDAARSDALFAEVGDACCRLWSVYPLATVAEIHGEYERADRLKRAGLAAAEGLGLTTEVPDLLAGIGRTALLRGDLAEARAYHAAARERAVEVGFRAGEINAVLGLGLGARREGLIDEAEAHMREVLDWHRAVGLDSANAL